MDRENERAKEREEERRRVENTRRGEWKRWENRKQEDSIYIIKYCLVGLYISY